MSATTIQILADRSDAVFVKVVRTQNDATQDTHTEVVNVATLYGATWSLTTDGNTAGMGVNPFQPGEVVAGVSSGAVGFVVAWEPSQNTLFITNNTANTFANGEKVVGQLTHNFVMLANANAVALVPAQLDIESMWFSVEEAASLQVEWEGVNNTNTAAYFTAVNLVETGYYGKNALQMLIRTPVGSNTFTGNGSIAVTSLGLAANGGYTVVLELHKTKGFSPVPDERTARQ